MGLIGDLDDGAPERQARARREVALAQVQVEVELVAGQGPAVAGRAGQQLGDAGVDDVELHVRVRRAVGRPVAAPGTPRVTEQAILQVQRSLVEQLALVHGRPADDELDPTLVGRGAADLLQPGLERGRRKVLDQHPPILASGSMHLPFRFSELPVLAPVLSLC